MPVVVVILVLAGSCPAGAAEPHSRQAGPSADAQSDVSPLDRLKNRSAVDRWKALSRNLRPNADGAATQVADWRNAEERRPVAAPLPIPARPPVVIRPFDIASRLNQAEDGESSAVKAFRSGDFRFNEPVPLEPEEDITVREPARDPRELKKITEILPYFDYEPDPEVARDDPCKYLCPRPDSPECKQYGPDEEPPACPEEIRLSDEIYAGRMIPESVFTWEASNLWHNPLYFEDAALERYGHTHHCLIQPFASVQKFGAQLVTLPYQAAIDPVCKRVYTLGWYRPGECAPKKHYVPGLNPYAGVVQAGVTTGMFFIFP